MGKGKKDKSPVINNIKNLNLEIDYDKLAKAMVKAQQEAEEQQEEEQQTKENTSELTICDAFKLIWYIICNKDESNITIASGLISIAVSLIFNFFAILSLIIMAFGIYAVIIRVKDFSLNADSLFLNLALIIGCFSFITIATTVAFIFRCIANEIGKEEDRNYVVSVFAAFVAFAALVVTVVSTIKGGI